MNIAGRPITPKPGSAVSAAYRAAARGRACTLRIPGVCCHDPDRTVGCHLRLFGAGGMGMKPADILMIDACSNCHDAIDDRARWADRGIGYDDVLRALMETLTARLSAGLIKIA